MTRAFLTSCPLSLFATLPLLLAASPAMAEGAEGPDEIVVTGQGLDPSPLLEAYSVSTLARDRTAASASGRIEDALASLAGFQQFRRSDSRSANPTAQGATLRGLGDCFQPDAGGA
ncbi:hypothetical protein [Novosphingobium sp.]|uniref:hypothetical protein n=1 Tax=Novosphingobium sp. TaxID=1874826 RepID=UPI0034136D36